MNVCKDILCSVKFSVFKLARIWQGQLLSFVHCLPPELLASTQLKLHYWVLVLPRPWFTPCWQHHLAHRSAAQQHFSGSDLNFHLQSLFWLCCFRANQEWPRWDLPILLWQFLYCTVQSADGSPCLYEARHPVTQWLENWMLNWWCQARKSAKLAQSEQNLLYFLFGFCSNLANSFAGGWFFFLDWNWER